MASNLIQNHRSLSILWGIATHRITPDKNALALRTPPGALGPPRFLRRQGMALRVLACGFVLSQVLLVHAGEIFSEPFLGVRHIQRVESSPRPLFINVLELDLESPELSFQVTPGGSHPRPFGTNGLPMETVRQTTRAYSNSVGAQLAVNASFYSTACSGCSNWANNLGLTVSNGDAYSPWEAPFTANFDDALNITQQNQAAIVRMPSSTPTGYETNPNVPLYNAVTGSHRLLSNGVNVAPGPSASDNLTQLHPRTAAGVTAGGKLVLMTVDGRQTGFSEGVTLVELAALLADYGVVNAINLDGGGSTSMVINPYGDVDSYGNALAGRLSNSPSETERAVGSNLAVFAAANPVYTPPRQVPAPPQSTLILDNFETGQGRFGGNLSASPSNYGVASASNSLRVMNESGLGQASQRLVVKSSNPSTPGLELTHLSSGGSPSNNPSLSSTGYLGFYLKVHPTGLETGDLLTSVVVNDGSQLERGVLQTIVADGQWHLYQWDLGNSESWEASIGGNGQIDATQVTLHGLHFSADSNIDFTVFIDMVAHNPLGGLAPSYPLGDFNRDFQVNDIDYQVWKTTFGSAVPHGTGADGNRDGIVNLADYTVWRDQLGQATSAIGATTIPEPSAIAVALICLPMAIASWLRS